jgi:glycosyltransferase involved in cell wall biosynthesis
MARAARRIVVSAVSAGSPFPAVSVVIPTRDRAALLPKAVESALGQRIPDVEVIVVDDGSEDGTERALGSLRGRIRYLRQDRKGVAAARNAGWRASSRSWIAFLDSDDWWEEPALERVLLAAREDGSAGLLAMEAYRALPDGRRTGTVFRKKSAGPYFSTESLLRGDAGSILTPVARRDLLERVGGFDEALVSASDCDLWLRLSFETRLRAVREPLLNVRVHEGNLSRDRETNARMWLRILEKLARDRPEWLARHAGTYRRALGKERLRLGRELLARTRRSPEALAEARACLGASIATHPRFARAFVYLAWSYVAPRTYAAWREREEARRG